MGWRLRLLAVFVMLVTLSLGAWPIALLAFLYLVLSVRRPRVRQVCVMKQRDAFAEPAPPWKRYAVGGSFLFLSLVALESGGTYSPVVFLLLGVIVIILPQIKRSEFTRRVTPVRDSVLLRSLLLRYSWHALVQVKLESQDQTRGIASMNGNVLLFAGKTPSVFQVVSVFALDCRRAERKVVKKLKNESRMLSQRGAHLLPLGSDEAAEKLSLRLERVELGSGDLDAASSLPFDVLVLRIQDGMVAAHRAYNISEGQGREAIVPVADIALLRQPLFVEVVHQIGEAHGWPGPDEFSPFLAALDASRGEPIADKVQIKGEKEQTLAVETPGGAQVSLTRPQLRALARIYG